MKERPGWVRSLPAKVGFVCLICAGVSLTTTPDVTGQTFYGSIAGTVSDSSGAIVPGTNVTLTNLGTAEKRTMPSDDAGSYRFVNLVPGRYRVEAEKTGFKRFLREPVVVEVENAVRIDVAMEVGEVTQTIEVSEQTPLLQSESSSLGQVVESRKVNELALNGRNPLALVALVPGVVPQGSKQDSSTGNPTGTNIFAWGNFQIGGGQANQSATYLDGGSVHVNYLNLLALVPTQDAIQEFKVQTNNLGPEFGRFAGGIINLTTKSGTNSFHGTAYEFLRAKVLNANDFFNNASGIDRPSFTQNQFGGNAGGRVLRDKLFWFAGYEGFRQRRGQSFLLSVPIPAFRQGDFSNLRDSGGNLIPIFDPLTTCGRLGNPAARGTARGTRSSPGSSSPGTSSRRTGLIPPRESSPGFGLNPTSPGNPSPISTILRRMRAWEATMTS
ncbi:MAG: carboxypeptidase-like regulatory domain-containing protein [Acidobacteria bacterium]|nr:carboxypeptidase-like regulatory domain-containing protein [Acidobacteriota bacterium]MCI0724242.1 carboxypeptidase-like regulatory domain-containing protein [Acidobacteriota bacterium]